MHPWAHFFHLFFFYHFVSQLTSLALDVQQSVLSLVPFQVSLLGFNLFVSVALQISIRVSCIPFGFACSFTSSFLQAALNKDVWHIKIFPKLGDVHITFDIFSMFHLEVFLFITFFPPLRAFSIHVRLLIRPFMGSFWEASRPKKFRMPPRFFSVLIELSSFFFWKGRLHFL